MNFVRPLTFSIQLYTIGQNVARSTIAHILLSSDPWPRNKCGKRHNFPGARRRPYTRCRPRKCSRLWMLPTADAAAESARRPRPAPCVFRGIAFERGPDSAPVFPRRVPRWARRHAAAFRALPAIDLVGDFLGGLTELALHEFVRFQVPPELQIFRALLLAQPFDLDQIRDHYSSLSARA